MSGFDFSTATMGDITVAVRAIDDTPAALAFFTEYVAFLEASGQRPEEALECARDNIGWCYGEGLEPQQVRMWREATGAEHPAGYIERMEPQEIFKAGMRWAEENKGKLEAP